MSKVEKFDTGQIGFQIQRVTEPKIPNDWLEVFVESLQ